MVLPGTGEGGRQSARPCLAVVYDITSSSPVELVTLVGSWCDIVWIVDLGDPALGSLSRLLPRLGTVVDTASTEFDDIPGMLDAARVVGVVAFTDTGLDLAARLGASLGLLANSSSVVERLVDKVAQRRALDAGGIEVPASFEIRGRADIERLAQVADNLSFPLVVKPVRGSGSRDTLAVRDLDQLRALFDPVGVADVAGSGPYIVEEYLEDRVPPEHQLFGDYVSVEMVVQAGRAVPVAVTGKFPLVEPFRETGNFMPHAFDVEEVAEVLALSADAVEAIGVRTGVLHAEIKLTPKGPRVVEVNGRIGGGGIDALFTRTHGRSLTELAVRVALGQRVELVAERPTRSSGPFAYEYFLQPPMSARRLSSIVGIDRIRGTAGAQRVGARHSPGDALDWRNGSQGYILQVTGTAPDHIALANVPFEINRVVELGYD